MSEFKFACPVCGQHITASSESSGRHLECPTCFQHIVVPQAPSLPDSKLILSAAQVAKPRPTTAVDGFVFAPARGSLLRRAIPIVGLVVVLAGAAAAAWVFRPKPAAPAPAAARRPAEPKDPVPFPIPADLAWSLNTGELRFPDTPAAGSLRGNGFNAEKVSIQGGVLSFRQGKRWTPELALTVALPARSPEELSGRTIEFPTNHPSALPRVSVRWKDEEAEHRKDEFAQGFALKVSFGQVAKGRLPGEIYLCLPDASRSVLAGTFDAEIKQPQPGKQPNIAPWPP